MARQMNEIFSENLRNALYMKGRTHVVACLYRFWRGFLDLSSNQSLKRKNGLKREILARKKTRGIIPGPFCIVRGGDPMQTVSDLPIPYQLY